MTPEEKMELELYQRELSKPANDNGGTSLATAKARLKVAKLALEKAKHARKAAPQSVEAFQALNTAQEEVMEAQGMVADIEMAKATRMAPEEEQELLLLTPQGKVNSAIQDPESLGKLLGIEDGTVRMNIRTDEVHVGGTLVNPDLAVTTMRERAGLVFAVNGDRGFVVPDYPRDLFMRGLELVASRNSYDPVAQYLDGLPKWDGVDRMGMLLVKLSVRDPKTLYATMLRKMMLAAIRRVRHPGIKSDQMLVLQAREGGEGKSSFYTALFGREFFSDSQITIGNKDAYLPVRRFWAIEWSEMAALHRSESRQAVKSFLTSAEDTYRAPYEHADRTHARRSIFVGSTNQREILEDDGGNRRFWIIPDVGIVDLVWVAQNRDQLWAQALVVEATGEPHYFPIGSTEWGELRDENQDNMFVDPIEEQAGDWIDGFEAFCDGHTVLGTDQMDMAVGRWPRKGPCGLTVAEISQGALGLPPTGIKKLHQASIIRALEKRGWAKSKHALGRNRRGWAPERGPVVQVRVDQTTPGPDRE